MKRQNKIKIFSGIAVLLILCILGGMYLKNKKAKEAFQTKGEMASQTQAETDSETSNELDDLLWHKIRLKKKKYKYSTDYETYLFMGTDGSGNEDADRDEYVGNMADFLMLAIVNRKEKTYAFLQLNRDTMTEINLIGKDGKGMATAEMQLCTAHWYGGTKEESCENTAKAVSKLLGGVTIDGYYAINMEDIGKLNHAVGGVTVTIDSDFGDTDPSLKEGETVTLSNEQAYSFLRYRMGVNDGENTSRMKRHRQYMEAFLQKVKEMTKQDTQSGVEIYNQLSEVCTTNMSGGLLADILTDMQGATDRGIFQMEGETKVGQHLDDGLPHTEFFLDKTTIVKELQNLYNIVDM